MKGHPLTEIPKNELYVKYLKCSDMFVFKGFTNSVIDPTVRISRNDLFSMLVYEDREKVYLSGNEEDYVLTNKRFTPKMLSDLDCDNDVYEDVLVIMYYWCVSVSVLNSVIRKQHTRKLGRVNSSWVLLNRRDFESYHNRGRKKGPIGLSEEDICRIQSMIDDYDRIVAVCVEKDRFAEYVMLERDIAKLNETVFNLSQTKKKFVEMRKKLLL